MNEHAEHPGSKEPDWIKKIKDLGRVEEILRVLLTDNIFLSLSKHDVYWNECASDPYDRLDECRMKFRCIQDEICRCIDVIRDEE